MDDIWEGVQNLFSSNIETDYFDFEVQWDCLAYLVLSILSFVSGLWLYRVVRSRKPNSPPQVELPKLVKFSYRWVIKDFLACDLISEHNYIDSSEFSPNGYEKERFHLRIYPRAGKDGNEVSIFLRYNPTPTEPTPPEEGESQPSPATAEPVPEQKVRIQFMCSLNNVIPGLIDTNREIIDSRKEMKTEIKSGETSGWSNYISRSTLCQYINPSKPSLVVNIGGTFVATH